MSNFRLIYIILWIMQHSGAVVLTVASEKYSSGFKPYRRVYSQWLFNNSIIVDACLQIIFCLTNLILHSNLIKPRNK